MYLWTAFRIMYSTKTCVMYMLDNMSIFAKQQISTCLYSTISQQTGSMFFFMYSTIYTSFSFFWIIRMQLLIYICIYLYIYWRCLFYVSSKYFYVLSVIIVHRDHNILLSYTLLMFKYLLLTNLLDKNNYLSHYLSFSLSFSLSPSLKIYVCTLSFFSFKPVHA